MFHFARTKVVQEWSPTLVFFQVLGDMLGQQNVAGIPAIHHSLRQVDPSAGDVGPFVYIDHAAHRSTVDSHPQMQARLFLEEAADLYRALRRGLRAGVKHQGHAIAGRNLKQASCSIGSSKLFRSANELI